MLARMMRNVSLIFCGAVLGGQALADPSHSAAHVALWPTIPFVRGQDLCQYQDAYGRTRAQQASDMVRLLGDLIRAGAEPKQAPELLQTLDSLIDQGRQRATGGFGMDVLLEGSFKAALDRVYELHHPQVRKVSFFNPTALSELVRVLRAQQRQGSLEAKPIEGLTGMAWGTYSFSPGCKGDVLVTTNSPRKAQFACECIQARLPTVGEYVYLNELGDWNGGVRSDKGLWALSQERVMAPEMPNPSMVRSIKEFQSPEIRYFCVRHAIGKKTATQCSP